MTSVIKRMREKLIIFTDLDGTLLDLETYSFKPAMAALRLIKKKGIPLILCSSKTGVEIEYYRKKLANKHPFISENGGGIFIPKDYFEFKIQYSEFKIRKRGEYFVICLGVPYPRLREVLSELRTEGFDVVGFGDMSAREVAELTGLSISEARRSKEREFDEPFIFKGDKASLKRLKACIKAKGFNFTEGEFCHITGNTNKGRAVEILKRLYNQQYRGVITVALGDSPNDIEMLEKVEYPVIVMKPDGRYDRRIKIKNLIKANGVGPEGWNRAIIKLLLEIT